MLILHKNICFTKLDGLLKEKLRTLLPGHHEHKTLLKPVSFSTASCRRAVTEATFEIQPCKLHRLEKGPPTNVTLVAEDAKNMYRSMLTMRKIEASATSLYKAKMVRGFCHTYTGQEAVAVGMYHAFRKMDTLITSYRCHAWTWIMGGSTVGVLCELTGKKSGCSRGKGGSMHMYGPNFYGGNGIVGAQIPLGTGLAFAHKYKKDGGIAYTLYGDGAANQGQFFESANMAYLWQLPCVFVCENNLYGLGTSAERSSASTEYYKRGDVIPGLWVDGMDVLATREATRFVTDFINNVHGPLVVEMNTYRFNPHSMSDPGTSYRTREEVARVREAKDPIAKFREKVIQANLVTEEEFKDIDKKVDAEVKEATKKAKTDPEVPLEELYADIYYAEFHDTIRGLLPNQTFKHIQIEPRKAL